MENCGLDFYQKLKRKLIFISALRLWKLKDILGEMGAIATVTNKSTAI